MQALIALLMLTQLASIRGYTLPQDDGSVILAMPDGRYSLYFGYGCDGLNVAENVDVVAGSGGVASLTPAGSDLLCDVFIGAPVSDDGCLTNADGTCDIANEYVDQ